MIPQDMCDIFLLFLQVEIMQSGEFPTMPVYTNYKVIEMNVKFLHENKLLNEYNCSEWN